MPYTKLLQCFYGREFEIFNSFIAVFKHQYTFEIHHSYQSLWPNTTPQVFPNSNYEESYLTRKIQTENSPTSFTDTSDLPCYYNENVTENKLRTRLHKNLKNASSGQDSIHAAMIKNLHSNSLMYLFSFFNSIFLSNDYPLLWM